MSIVCTPCLLSIFHVLQCVQCIITHRGKSVVPWWFIVGIPTTFEFTNLYRPLHVPGSSCFDVLFYKSCNRKYNVDIGFNV